MKSIRIILLLAIFICGSLLFAAGKLNMHVSSQRFMNTEKKTLIHIDYQIPYNNLVFLAHKGGYFAEVDVTVQVAEGDSVIFSQSIRDNIGISNKEDARSNKTYLNRVSFLLNDQPYEFRIDATDINSESEFSYSFTASRINADALVSDLELCSVVRPDSSAYLEKFRRGNILYQTQPSLIFDKTAYDFISLYFEVYTDEAERSESGLILMEVEKDSVIVTDDYIDFSPLRDIDGLTLKIPISDLAPGKYEGSLELQIGERSEMKDFTFFVTEQKQPLYFVFPNPDEDFQLLRYFLGSSLTTSWKNYDYETKRRYVSQSWKSWAQANAMSTESMLDTVHERVDYANKYYGHFDPGWTSDRGRIHIRNGKPDEIYSDTSSDETRYVRKDYQIWKYRGKLNAVYLFVDMQMSGNYKLVYVNNDERETSNPDYLKYLGDDFDTSLLEN